MTYAEAVQFLYDLQMFGLRLGLENTRELTALIGHPQTQLRFIHVAGTNGKGSTCAMLESIYRAAGLRVGLFTSPHLVKFGERIQVNRTLLGEADIIRYVEKLRVLLSELPADAQPTFFEAVTVMALLHFAEQKCDLVIWETGLGGRLDATNIVTPLASVITNIGLDHQKWLGDTLAKIAAEKAGIIKPKVPVITGTTSSEALAVIEAEAKAQHSPLTVVPANTSQHELLNGINLPLQGLHQRHNAALALAVVATLQSVIPVSIEAQRRGLETVYWPGRMQRIQRGDQTLILDGAHNEDGIRALANSLPSLFPNQKPTLIVGMLQDKEFTRMSGLLAPLASRILTAPVDSERTASANDLADACRTANPTTEISACQNLAQALDKAKADPYVVITGSLYFVGEALELLGAKLTDTPSERGLNEWQPSSSTRSIKS